MTTSLPISQLLVRLDRGLKKDFETLAAEKWLSMNFLITSFVRTYTKNPDIIRTDFDEEAFDRAWQSENTQEAFQSLNVTLKKKWLL